MWLKIFGSVMKIRLGPEVWSTLNVKHAGKIISRGCDRNKCIQDRNVYGFSKECVIFSNVASKDSHGADTKAKCKECLIHGTSDGGNDTDLFHTCKIPGSGRISDLLCTVHGKAVDCQDNHDHQKGRSS